MSDVTAVLNLQHQSNLDNTAHCFDDTYTEDTKNSKNLSIINLYAIYKNFSKIEKKQFINKLPTAQQNDLQALAMTENPVIDLLYADPVLVVQQNSAVKHIKAKQQDLKNANQNKPIIVIDEFKHYLGIIEIADLVTSDDDTLAVDLYVSKTKLFISETQQNAEKIIAKNNDYFAVLTNSQNAVVGLLMLTDIIKAKNLQPQEVTPPPYLQTSVLSHVRQRIFWILALASVGLLSGIIIQSYDDAITALIILAFYMPMVADTGGNVGSQAATVIIRSIAMGELRLKNWFAILYKELRIALFIGVGLACVSYLKIYFLSYGIELPEGLTLTVIAFAIALAIFVQVLSATIIGASLPLLVKWCNQDPAVVASPAITTIVDVTGLLIYFYITSSMLLY